MTNAGNTREFHISRMDYDIELSYVENAQNIQCGCVTRLLQHKSTFYICSVDTIYILDVVRGLVCTSQSCPLCSVLYTTLAQPRAHELKRTLVVWTVTSLSYIITSKFYTTKTQIVW